MAIGAARAAGRRQSTGVCAHADQPAMVIDALDRVSVQAELADDCGWQRNPGGVRSLRVAVSLDRNVAEWHGKMLVDRDGEIGKLQDVYVDVENDEPQFATVNEGLKSRHLTFVPLGGLPDRSVDLPTAVRRMVFRLNCASATAFLSLAARSRCAARSGARQWPR